MDQEQVTRTPASGEVLILADGRTFVLDAIESSLRAGGLWFTAQAQDGRCTLQSNVRLTWDVQARAWRPATAQRNGQFPPSMRRTPTRAATNTTEVG